MPKVRFGRDAEPVSPIVRKVGRPRKARVPAVEGMTVAEPEVAEPVYAEAIVAEPVYADPPPDFTKVTECDGVLQVDWNGFAILNFADRLSPANTKDWFDMRLVGKTGHFKITVEWWEKKDG